MKFQRIDERTIIECRTETGEEYVRFFRGNWAQWRGESLDMIQSEARISELELVFTATLSHND